MSLGWVDIGLILFTGIVIGFLYALYDRKKMYSKNFFLHELITYLPVAFFYHSCKKDTSFCSKDLALSLNLTDQSISWDELITHFDLVGSDGLDKAYKELCRTKVPFDQVIPSSNHLFTFKVKGCCLKQGDILVTFSDISEQNKKMSQYLQKLQDQENNNDILINALENLPFPLFIRDHNGKNVFANPAVTQTAKSLNDMDWLSLPFKSRERFFTMTYGQDTKTEEELKIILNKMTAAHRRLCQELPCPVCLFNAKGELIACSKSFAKLWHLTQNWLDSVPSFEEYWDTVQENGLLARVADFAGYKRQQREHFARLSQASELFLYLPDGRLVRRVMIPYVQGSVILLDEISEIVKK